MKTRVLQHWRRALPAVFVSFMLVVDPFTLGVVSTSSAAFAMTGAIDESRAQNLAAALSEIGVEVPVASQPLVSPDRPAPETPGPLELPNALPQPDTKTISLSGAAPASVDSGGAVPAAMFSAIEPAAPTQVVTASGGGKNAGKPTTSAFSAPADTLLVALVSSDTDSSGSKQIQVVGASLTWTRKAASDAQPGAAEVWVARTTTALSSVTVTAIQSGATSTKQYITVLGFAGADVGASGTGSAAGTPKVDLVGTKANAVLVAAGNVMAEGPVPLAGQTLLYKPLLVGGLGVAYWTQSAPGGTAGATTTIGLSAPTAQFNMAAVEIVPTSTTTPAPTPTPTTPPAPEGPVEVDLGGMAVGLAPVEGVESPTAVTLRVADRDETAQAGVDGVLMDIDDASTVSKPGRALGVTVSYADYAGLKGGDWASRLRMVWIPDCAQETPEAPECRSVPLDTVNDPVKQQVTATVAVTSTAAGSMAAGALPRRSTVSSLAAAGESGSGGGRVAVTGGVAGPDGNWGATTLAPSAKWSTSGATGSFAWSYPMRAPKVAAGPSPKVEVSYSSSAADGRVPSTNNQSGVLGEGFDLSGGYVERSYLPCSKDESGAANNIGRRSGDLCWGVDNATLKLDGSAVEVVKDTATGQWRARRDDGTKIELLTGGWSGIGSGEYWRVTTVDGTQYFFGRGQRSATDTTALKSAWSVPVYGNHPGEPCYQSNFAAARCDQVWRWNLDYVIDPSGNSMTYFYEAEENRYVPDFANNTTSVSYTAGGRLTRVEYGTRTGAEASGTAPAKVEFEAAPRCITDVSNPSSWCSQGQSDTAANRWPDTPTDLVCVAVTGCRNSSPSFFDRRRLTKIATYTYDGATYQPIDSWTFGQAFAGQGAAAGIEHSTGVMLTLTSITHTGHGGTTAADDDITLPSNTFGYQFLVNRVDALDDGYPSMPRPRLDSIATESGGSMSITYNQPSCTPANQPGTSDAAQRDNTKACFPVKWYPEGDYNTDGTPKARIDYFHKYLVGLVAEYGSSRRGDATDELITGSSVLQTSYTYSENAAWVRPTGANVQASEVTYSEFRGYETVTTTVGTGSEASARSVRYLRGLGTTLNVGPDGHQVSVTDHERFQGLALETVQFNGDEKVSQTISAPDAPKLVASGANGVNAYRAAATTTYGFTYDAAGELEYRTKQSTTFDDQSQPISIDDQGDVSIDDDDLCTTITYTHTTNSTLKSKHLVTLPALTEVVNAGCGTVAERPAQLVTSTKNTYDDSGRPLRTEQIDPTDGQGYVLTAEVLAYDSRGRAVRVSDALGRVSEMSYQDTAAGLPSAMISTTPDPDGVGAATPLTSKTLLNPSTGTVASTIDANGRETKGTYDGLGRLVQVRYPQHLAAAVPSIAYEYTVEPGGLNAVVTKTIAADGQHQHAAATLYDGLLRPFQTQAEGKDAGLTHDADAATRGRMVAHTVYDSAGRVRSTTGQWWATGVPAAEPIVPVAVPPSSTTFEYDSAGRVTDEVFWVGPVSNPENEQWRTKTSYDGATVVAIPPMGDVPSASTRDARGRVVELREFSRDPDTDGQVDTLAEVLALPSQMTTYTYDAAGRLVGMQNQQQNSWEYTYDWGGRRIGTHDPDAGASTSTYDAAGQLTSRTDGEGRTVAYTYDTLGRMTTLRDDSPTGPVRAEWLYDTVLKGMLTSSTRITSDGSRYTTAVTGYDTANRPTGTRVTLPAVGDLSKLGSRVFTTSVGYTADGQQQSVSLPPVTSSAGAKVLGAETVTTGFDTASMPTWSGGGFGWGAYVATSRFTAEGRLLLTDLGNTYGAVASYEYQDGTNRLVGVSLDRERFSGTDLDVRYQYDPAGNVTSISDTPTSATLAGTAHQDHQCFEYDGSRRLELAYTSSDSSCDGPSPAGIGGAAPYWTEYGYDVLGNRTSMTEHATDGSSGSVTTGYEVGGDGAGPHQVTAEQTLNGLLPPTERRTFAYDDAGNQISRTDAAATPTSLSWDAEGELVSAGGAEFVYDADGNRLVREDSTGTTVYLPGGQEVHITAGGLVSATRYYSFAGVMVAVRTGSGMGKVTSVVTDHHGTPLAAMPNTSWSASSVRRMYTDPFGAARGTSDQSTVPGDVQFLGKTRDASTEFTLLGARYYDETLGRFLSVDPVMDLADPQQWNAYTYAGNNPLAFQDASGLRAIGATDYTDENGKNFRPAANGTATTASPKTVEPPVEQVCVSGACWSSPERSNVCGYSYNPCGKAPEPWYKAPANAQIWEMVDAWASGAGKDFVFDDGDPFTHLFKNGDNAAVGLEWVRAQLRAGVGEGGKGEQFINIFEEHGEWIVRDGATIVGGGRMGNLADAFVGSYRLDYTVVNSAGDRAIVELVAYNETTIDSATRIPKIGGNFWPVSIPMEADNRAFGMWETISQTISWRQEVRF